jgi:Protein of unknown function (DUF2845)
MRALYSVLTLALIAAAITGPAAADPLRCGSVLVDVGAQASYVLAKCGEPTTKTTIAEAVQARNAGGHVSQTGATQTQVWRYNRGSTQLPAVVTIADGVVQSIEFEKPSDR